MRKLIAVCEFATSTKQYEYLCEVADDANLDELKFAVTLNNFQVTDKFFPQYLNKSTLEKLAVVFVREFKPIVDQMYAGGLKRVVLAFGIREFVEHSQKLQKIEALKTNLERRLNELSVFDKIKSLGSVDPTLTQLADELKKLINEAN